MRALPFLLLALTASAVETITPVADILKGKLIASGAIELGEPIRARQKPAAAVPAPN